MNILAIVAHPDDEILGCGATLRRLANEGHNVYSAVLCAHADARHDRPEDLERIALDAARLIGIRDSALYRFPNIQFNAVPHIELVQAIEAAIERFMPEWIFTLHPGDANVDHRVVHEAAMAAIRLPQRLTRAMPVTMIRKVLLCEVLSSTDWALPLSPPFVANTWFDISSSLEQKIEALNQFEGAMKPFPHSRSVENVRHLAAVRGAQIGVPMAEAFQLVRDVYP